MVDKVDANAAAHWLQEHFSNLSCNPAGPARPATETEASMPSPVKREAKCEPKDEAKLEAKDEAKDEVKDEGEDEAQATPDGCTHVAELNWLEGLASKITCVDQCAELIASLREKYKDKAAMEFEVADAANLPQDWSDRFDLVLDKALLDTVVAGRQGWASAEGVLQSLTAGAFHRQLRSAPMLRRAAPISQRLVGRRFSAAAEAVGPSKWRRRLLLASGAVGVTAVGVGSFSTVEEKPVPTRADQIKRLASGEEFDILVVGGGATGAGVALEAQLRGLKEDFASGTSSKSTKLLWAGSRYLVKGLVKLFSPSSLMNPVAAWSESWTALLDTAAQQSYGDDMEFAGTWHMVLGCFRERTYMLTMNPHITNWVPIAVPLDKWIIWPPPFEACLNYASAAGESRLQAVHTLLFQQGACNPKEAPSFCCDWR
eukprot:s2731_g16.t1